MYGLNKAQIIGHVGNPPELKTTGKDVSVCTFSVATNEGYKGADGQWVDKTEWHNVVAWRKLADLLAGLLVKGSKVYIEGKLETQSWEKDGVKHYRTQIVCSDFVLLDKREGGARADAPYTPSDTAPDGPASGRDNGTLPF